MNNNEEYNRWQKIRIDQLTFSINVFLSISIAIIGFLIKLLSDLNSSIAYHIKVYYMVAIILLVLSVILGLLCSINRLNDFRLNAEMASNSIDSNKKKIKLSKIKGRYTWIIFWFQTGFLFSGFILAIFVILYGFLA